MNECDPCGKGFQRNEFQLIPQLLLVRKMVISVANNATLIFTQLQV